jgi:hypothetical protein
MFGCKTPPNRLTGSVVIAAENRVAFSRHFLGCYSHQYILEHKNDMTDVAERE